MALRKRGRLWWVFFTTPAGTRVRRSTGTEDRQAAQEYHDTLRAHYWRIHKLGEKPRRTWQEAVLRWCKEKKTKRDIDRDVAKFAWLDAYLKDVPLDAIDNDLVTYLADAKEAEGVEGATVNRYLALLRAVLRKAWREWQWIEGVPVMPMRQESDPRVRWLTEAEVQRLLAALPEYYRRPAAFSLATGPRQRNVLSLKWSQVDLKRRVAWVAGAETKNGQPLAIPLNDDAVAVLEVCKGHHEDFVFTRDGKPLWGIDSQVWKAALQEAEIEDFRWHDLRHTWASRHIQSGTTLEELQRLGGWKTYAMVLRYAHLSTDQLRRAAENICGTACLPDAPPPARPKLYLVKS